MILCIIEAICLAFVYQVLQFDFSFDSARANSTLDSARSLQISYIYRETGQNLISTIGLSLKVLLLCCIHVANVVNRVGMIGAY